MKFKNKTMSGRTPIKAFEYDEKGKFIKEHLSIASVKADHYGSKWNTPLFRQGDIQLLPNGSLACKERIGRKGVIKYFKYKSSPYIKENWPESVHSQKEIIVSNVNGQTMARFENIHVAVSMTGKTYNMIASYLTIKKTGDLLQWKLSKL